MYLRLHPKLFEKVTSVCASLSEDVQAPEQNVYKALQLTGGSDLLGLWPENHQALLLRVTFLQTAVRH